MWADGIYLQGRLEDEKQCILVLIGATPEGRKELVGFQAGVRESAQSWRELLACLRGRGLTNGPELAIGDGALGFWKALEEIFPDTRRQRCWVHKTANVLNKLAKSRQTAAKAALHDIWMADGRAEAERAMNTFAAKYDAKYPQAVACLTKDRDALLAFYDFPAEHWRHIRTTNPIESVFATVRHRTVRTKGCLSHRTTLAMVFKLITTASKTWRRLMGNNQLPKVIEGVRFQRRYADRRNQNSRRRLITPSPKIGHNSADLPFPHSLPEFQRLFPDDATCAAYLEKARWGDGFACPHCGTAGEPFHFENRPGVLRCRKCRQNTGLTVGTVMERSHTPLNVWFWAAYLVASQTPGMSAVQFQRQLGLSRYETAFQILHKLRSGMVRPNQDRIGGQPKNHVEVDETWVGGRTRGEGRGVHHKVPVSCAIEVRHRKPGTKLDNRKDGRYAGRVRPRRRARP